MRITIKNGELNLFRRVLKNGYAIENGHITKRFVRELKHAGIAVYHGNARGDVKKVIVALESPVSAMPMQRTLTKTIFEVKT